MLCSGDVRITVFTGRVEDRGVVGRDSGILHTGRLQCMAFGFLKRHGFSILWSTPDAVLMYCPMARKPSHPFPFGSFIAHTRVLRPKLIGHASPVLHQSSSTLRLKNL